MCGIVGFITKEHKKGELTRSKFLRQALIIDTLRGDDSTGAFAVGHEPMYKDGSAYWYKALGTGHDFVDTKEYWENFADVSTYRCVVGHNRAATVGGVSTETAHPFQEGPITLVHNGTLTTSYTLPTTMATLDGVTVDSHAICHNLALHDVKKVVENLNGAFALVWHDARDDSINVVRNDKRPLHFGLTKDQTTLYFMSEGEMLHMLDTRIGLGLQSIHYPDEGVYLKWLPDTPLTQPITEVLDLYEDYWDTIKSAYSGTSKTYSSGSKSYNYPKVTSSRENWVHIGGRRQEVPMVSQEALLHWDITVEDRLEFTVNQYGMNPQDKDAMYVTGTITGHGKGIIYSVSPTSVDKGRNNWTVRAVGVKVDQTGEPWFICKLVSTYRPERGPVDYSTDYDGYSDSSYAWNDDDEIVGYVPGKGGRYVSQDEFRQQVADGCVMCHHPIHVGDCYDLIWVGEGPICPMCDERHYVSPALKGDVNHE